MKRRHLTFIIFVLLAEAQTVLAQTTLAILPINQSQVPVEQQLSDDYVYQSVLARLTSLRSVHALSFDQLIERHHDDMVDEAVFELLVTGELDRTLARLHAWESEASWQQKLLGHPDKCPADWLVSITVRPNKRTWQITYTVVHVGSSHTVAAYSFREVDDDPTLVANEIAKRLVRSLWKVLETSVSFTLIQRQ